jgi:hypothetical protein
MSARGHWVRNASTSVCRVTLACLGAAASAIFAAEEPTTPTPMSVGPTTGRRSGMAETVVLSDSLVGATRGQQVGGVLTDEGFQPREQQGHILYRLPSPVREGYLEVEVKGMDASGLPANSDHAFLGMYDGRGVVEPAGHDRDFVTNFYRWNIHWRQSRNAFKSVISCAAPTPERVRAARARYDGARDWSGELTGKGMTWGPGQWHRLRVEWCDKTFLIFVDGEEKWRMSGPSDYAPTDHRIWLGSAPGKNLKYMCLVPGIIYRNFKLVALRREGS